MLFVRCPFSNKSVWGQDADKWNPERHLDQTLKEGQIPVGLYSNLLVFFLPQFRLTFNLF